MMISVTFALALAMSPAPPDAMITQVRGLVAWPRAKCWDPNQRYINGICVFNAPPVPSQARVCCMVGRRLHRALWDAQGVAGSAGSLSRRQRWWPVQPWPLTRRRLYVGSALHGFFQGCFALSSSYRSSPRTLDCGLPHWSG